MNELNEKLIGSRIGRLTIVSCLGVCAVNRKIPVIMFLCRCDCGNEATVSKASLTKRLPTQSCGCLAKDINAERFRGMAKHGMTNSLEYSSWRAMLTRCGFKNYHAYNRYGGRGIKVCDRWLKNFENFYADMGKKPSPKSTLDRIDNDGDYSPENCRWADVSTQSINRSTNRVISFRGKTQRITQWADELGVNVSILCKRFSRGWSVEEVLTTELNPKRRPKFNRVLNFRGKSQTLTEWSLETGLSVQTISWRLKTNWPLEQALTIPAGKK